MVTVKQANEAENVVIFVKMAADESIEGLVVTVIDSGKKEVVFVNLVGNITPQQLATIGQRLNIEPLSHLTGKYARKSN